MLFFDVRLSKQEDRSCAGCHDPKREFADGRTLPVGSDAQPVIRHVPTLWNLAWSSRFFWDGRAESLEEQVLEPIRTEMALTFGELVGRLSSDPDLGARFAEAFPADPKVTAENVAAALATYIRTLVSPRNRFDAWVDGDESALSPGERRGFAIFNGKAGCSRCHTGWAFTDNRFHDTGIARRRSRTRRRGERPGSRPRLQDADAARRSLVAALHAQRADREAAVRRGALRAQLRAASDGASRDDGVRLEGG